MFADQPVEGEGDRPLGRGEVGAQEGGLSRVAAGQVGDYGVGVGDLGAAVGGVDYVGEFAVGGVDGESGDVLAVVGVGDLGDGHVEDHFGHVG